jgi:3-keto-5-aminohexanoate cleavage enzyme
MERTSRSAFPPLVICCAISGGVQGKEVHPELPETAEEQIESAVTAAQAGASMIHIHVRNTQRLYETTDQADEYRAVNRGLRTHCPDVIINNSTGGSYGMNDAQRLVCLDAGPEVASLNLGPEMYRFSMRERKAPLTHPRPEVHLDGLHPVTYGQVHHYAKEMKQRGIKPELELYNPGMYWVVRDLLESGLIDNPPLVQFVLGTMTGSHATPWTLISLLQELPAGCLFEVAAIGPYQLPLTTMAIMLGGHVRVGMEDNLYLRKGQRLHSNAEAVARVVRIANELNRPIATPAQAREILGLAQVPSQP